MDFLYVVAEVGAAFAGFSTLVAAIAERSNRDANTMRTVSMLSLSLIAVLFALLPALPGFFGISGIVGWRVISLVYALAWLGYWVGILGPIFTGRFGATFRELSAINRFNACVTHPALVLLLLSNAFGVFGQYVGAVYATALMVMLSLSALLFLQMVISTFSVKTEVKQSDA